MPNNDPYQNAPHLQPRLAVAVGGTDDGARFDGWGGPPVPQHIRTWHQMHADEYVRRLAEGGTGGEAFGYLHSLRYGPASAYVDPWRLVGMIAGQVLALSAPDAGSGVHVSPLQRDGIAVAGSEGGEREFPPSPASTRPAPDPAPGADITEGPVPA